MGAGAAFNGSHHEHACAQSVQRTADRLAGLGADCQTAVDLHFERQP